MTGSTAQGTPPQDQPGTPGQAQGTPPQGSAPWTNALQENFPDEAQRQAVDAFLRQTVQPHVTQLEQSAKPALDFHTKLQENPGATYLELTEDLFGEDAAKKVQAAIEAEYGEESPEVSPPVAQNQQPQPPEVQRDPAVQELLDDYENKKNEAAYNAELQRLQDAEAAQKAANPDYEEVPIKDHLFRPFVIATDGDVDAAFDQYKQFVAAARTDLLGQNDPPPPTPPPTLGIGNAGGAAPTPTETQHESFGDALDAWAAEQKAEGQSIIPKA